MIKTAKQIRREQLIQLVQSNVELKEVLNEIDAASVETHMCMLHHEISDTTHSALKSLGYNVEELEVGGSSSYRVTWDDAPIDEGSLNSRRFETLAQFEREGQGHNNRILRSQRVIIILCSIIIILLLLLSATGVVLIRTKQTGLIALIDVPATAYDIPDMDPSAIILPDDDPVSRLNEKLDAGKMCINMVSKVVFKNSYSSGVLNIINDEINNYPQFVTITLDSNGTQIYQSGLIEVGKSVPYAMLEIALPAGTYECTATFSQVDTASNKICGQAAAKVTVIVQE